MSDNNDSACLDPVPRCDGGGRRQGIPNHHNKIQIPIIKEILPNGSEAWCLVAIAYKEKSREEHLRSEDDLKRNWVHKLCNNMKKPTGRSGVDPNDHTNRCLEIRRKILDKTALGILGASSDNEKRFAPSLPSSSSSLSSDGEVVPGTEVQLPASPLFQNEVTKGFEANDDFESTDGFEATDKAEATDVAKASANIDALAEGSAEANTEANNEENMEVALATSINSRSSSFTR